MHPLIVDACLSLQIDVNCKVVGRESEDIFLEESASKISPFLAAAQLASLKSKAAHGRAFEAVAPATKRAWLEILGGGARRGKNV